MKSVIVSSQSFLVVGLSTTSMLAVKRLRVRYPRSCCCHVDNVNAIAVKSLRVRYPHFCCSMACRLRHARCEKFDSAIPSLLLSCRLRHGSCMRKVWVCDTLALVGCHVDYVMVAACEKFEGAIPSLLLVCDVDYVDASCEKFEGAMPSLLWLLVDDQCNWRRQQ